MKPQQEQSYCKKQTFKRYLMINFLNFLNIFFKTRAEPGFAMKFRATYF